jgi:hypothetical protein
MEQEQRQAAKREMLKLMQAGQPWQGEAALQDGRQGHPAKVLPRVLHWLESRLQATSLVPSSQMQKELQEQLAVRISLSHLNAVRAMHGWSNAASQAGEKTGRSGSQRSAGSRRAVIAGRRS